MHLTSNKSCLKLRGLEMDSKFSCEGCKTAFMNKVNLSKHLECCKKYISLSHGLEIKKKEDDHKDEYNNLKLYCSKLEKELHSLKFDRDEYIKLKVIHEELRRNHDDMKNRDLLLTHTKLEIKYEELYKQHEELKNQHEKMISKLEMKISQCDTFIQTLARDGSNKPTTTNNTVNNTVRNQLSATFTLDGLEPKKIEETMREHYTELDFFGGQKRLANFFLERVIKTPDDKMLICCTDTSRKKFKILDLRGNLKEDIEARTLCEKLKVPTQMVTKEIYDKVIEKIDGERVRLSSDDRSRREKLLDDTMRAQRFYMDNLNFDDLNYNQDFMHELCVLLNV